MSEWNEAIQQMLAKQEITMTDEATATANEIEREMMAWRGASGGVHAIRACAIAVARKMDARFSAALATPPASPSPAPAAVAFYADDEPLSEADQRMIDAAWETHKAAAPAPAAVEELVARLEEEAQGLQQLAWSRTDGGQSLTMAAMLLEEAATALSATSEAAVFTDARVSDALTQLEALASYQPRPNMKRQMYEIADVIRTALSTLAADKATAKLEAACKAKDEQISECSRLASRVLELDEALRVAKAELENHTEVPGVSEYVLPAIEAALSSSTNPELREN